MDDFKFSNSGGDMGYRYYDNLNLMIEVIAFDRLIVRANNRNEAFVKMLDGQSNYGRTPKRALSAAE